MLNDLFRLYKRLIIILVILIVFISIFFTPFINGNYIIPKINEISINEKTGFAWPTPGYTVITSPFGKRISPTTGASSYHARN